MDEIFLEFGKGLYILPADADVKPYKVYGSVSYKMLPGDGQIFYCAGQSFPAAIVAEILEEEGVA